MVNRQDNPEHNQQNRFVDYYGATYSNFAKELYVAVRRDALGNEDIGQTGWLTASELQSFLGYMGDIQPDLYLLDVCSGAGGPAITIATQTGCRVIGVDIHEQAVTDSNIQAANAGIVQQVQFKHLDANLPLPFAPATFDAIVCIDAIIHLKNRVAVLTDWSRVLKPGGRILYTDTCVVTGPVSKDEIVIRGSIGYFVFTPPGVNERSIQTAGLQLLACNDVTANMADIAQRWHSARAVHEADLRQIEDDATYDGQQTFFRVTSLLAHEHRLSRLLYVAEKPTSP